MKRDIVCLPIYKSILLKYVCDGEINLTIYGDYTENIAFRNNIHKHKNREDVIYRKH